jgi:RHS repeat-associated protein
VTQYVWDEDIVLLEIDNTEGTRTQYTQGPGEWGMLVSQQVNTTVTYLGSDDRNNVRLLLPQAGIGTSAGYKAFGSVLPTPGTPATPFQYGGNVGYYAESPTAGVDDTEFYRTLHRIYRFHSGRFPQPDPTGINGGYNLYGYAGNNPISNFDPSGEGPLTRSELEKLHQIIKSAGAGQQVPRTRTTPVSNAHRSSARHAHRRPTNHAHAPASGVQRVLHVAEGVLNWIPIYGYDPKEGFFESVNNSPIFVLDADDLLQSLATGWAGFSTSVWATPVLQQLNDAYHVYVPAADYSSGPGYKFSVASGRLGVDALLTAAGIKLAGLLARPLTAWWNQGIERTVPLRDLFKYEIGQKTLSGADFVTYGKIADPVERGAQMIIDNGVFKATFGLNPGFMSTKGTLLTGPTPGGRLGVRALGIAAFLYAEYTLNKSTFNAGKNDVVSSLK